MPPEEIEYWIITGADSYKKAEVGVMLKPPAKKSKVLNAIETGHAFATKEDALKGAVKFLNDRENYWKEMIETAQELASKARENIRAIENRIHYPECCIDP